ncbi:MAG: 50S ribosomal protein L24 [Actinobacteria bacterium]|nr:50S ribosomal protein L24 [Actinomycetota bacterium]MCG2818755.1 50S ribosomal protein L24 [Actinomycetes bacterium]MBU4217689.1 50S ribosomal protein L24 [Actinomycetota bacterium]MBU4358998.1 50S ribosomal protein L24 [Actinomycetota bacterium]MBU4391661.1 50S ribosomal protein L24 [Actinomycetota bacterium]
MKSMHIRKGDTVQVLTGKDKGRRGKVLKVDPGSRRLLVEGINRAKKHMRPSQANPQGGVVDWELPIDISNVMLVCSGCERPTRVRRLRTGGKSIIRVCKSCDREF